MKKIYSLLSAAVILLTAFHGSAQDQGYLYGKIHMDDGNTYEGAIRWGKEEVYWTDVFNASKKQNDYIHYLSEDEREKLDDRHRWQNGNYFSSSTWRWLGIGSDDERYRDSDYIHQFSCQFGEIKSIRLLSSKRAEVELQSGLRFKVDGEGYNDLGTDLKVIDKEIGDIDVSWNRIERVEFKNTPASLATKFGEPLYGTVETFQGKFTGYIQWDHDERLTTDKLDGDSEDGKVAIMFDKITTLEPHMNRCDVTLKSGRMLELRNSNDVNSENRGIIITDESGMIVDVPWSECKRVVLKPVSGAPAVKYENFASQKELRATVLTQDGKKFTGRLVLDLDEEYDFELFQGKSDELNYAVPLRSIKNITVINGILAEVRLANGTKVTLEDSQDTGELNQGVLVFETKDRPVYIAWEDVRQIDFQ